MLHRLSPREKFDLLIAQYEPGFQAAFREAVDELRSAIVLRRVVERLEKGDIAGAIGALNIEGAAFNKLDEAVRQAFNGGGTAAVTDMPVLKDPEGHRVVIRFDVRNPPAENWLREHSSALITNIVEDTKVAARTIMEQGLREGANPTRTALNIAGRINRVTGRREGGILGLSSPQVGYVTSMRQRLLSGDPDELRKVLNMTRRDKRFDPTILKAIQEGKPVPADMVSRMTGRYSDSLLKLRADTIARTETMAALGESKKQAYLQAIAKGTVDVNTLTKVWLSPPKTKEARIQHQAMGRQTVKFMEKFRAPDGTLLEYPGDPAAPIEHTANCRCDWDVRIDFFAELV